MKRALRKPISVLQKSLKRISCAPMMLHLVGSSQSGVCFSLAWSVVLKTWPCSSGFYAVSGDVRRTVSAHALGTQSQIFAWSIVAAKTFLFSVEKFVFSCAWNWIQFFKTFLFTYIIHCFLLLLKLLASLESKVVFFQFWFTANRV